LRNVDESTKDFVDTLLGLFDQGREKLKEYGWFPGDPYSPKWWGGLETKDELIISAILVQQTRWETVKKVMERLRALNLSTLEGLRREGEEKLVEAISGVNFRRVKARRLKLMAGKLSQRGLCSKESLISVEGIGEETADSLLLFACNVPTFPVSQYVIRVLSRVTGQQVRAKEIGEELKRSVGQDLYSLKLLYAGISTVGKAWCHRRKPSCNGCMLSQKCHYSATLPRSH